MMKGGLRTIPVVLSFLSFAHLSVGKDGGELTQELKDLIEQPSHDGPTFGKHMSVAEKEAFKALYAGELEALKSGCTNAHCEAWLGSSDVGNVRRSLTGLDAFTCLETICTDQLLDCEADKNCGWWLDNCMDDENPNCADKAQNAVALAPLTKCYFDNCESDVDSGPSTSDGASSVGFARFAEANSELLTDCLSRTCKSDYEFCAENSDCTSYLNECLETGESASGVCQQYRTQAWLGVKFLIYCYDAHCGGDGVQSEREKTEEEATKEWDQQDVCEDHPRNWHSCDENIHCLHADEHEDSWCSPEEARVMCRDCAGSGEKCESSNVCQDELLWCDQLSEEEKAVLDPSHPCVHQSCAASRSSVECAGAVFEHCCNPELETCVRTERSTCSSSGCSRFTDPNSHHQFDYEKITCPFENAIGTCEHPSCKDPGMFREIVDLFVGGGNRHCRGPWCFQEVMMETCPDPTAVTDGRINETNSTENRRRELHGLMQQGRRPFSLMKKHDFLLTFQNSTLPMFPSQRLQVNRELKTEGTSSDDPSMQCMQDVCSTELQSCIDDADCNYAIEHCDSSDDTHSSGDPTEDFDLGWNDEEGSFSLSLSLSYIASITDHSASSDSSTTYDCESRMDAAKELMDPLKNCYDRECNSDFICAEQSCPEMQACTAMDDCKYVLFHCMGDDPTTFGTECDARYTDQVKGMMESIIQCHSKHCNNDPIMQCMYNDCEFQMEACHLDEECDYVLGNCMDSQAAASDCEYRRANNDTGTLVSSIEQCYTDQCLHLDDDESQNEFAHVLSKARQCLNDEDGCAWANEGCDEDDACGEPLAQLFQCVSEECASQIIEQNILNKAFAEVIFCVERECEVGGGDSDDHGPPSINTREECAAVLSSYCSNHPEEKACQSPCPYGCKAGEFCPCSNESCLAEYAAPMCARFSEPCREYKEQLNKIYLNAGHYQPRDEWNRNRIAHFLMDPPPDDLDMIANLPLELEGLGEACNAVHQNLADHISSCMVPSIDFCNMNEWDQGCRSELSKCGDGVVSWHENCDDGNEVDRDGCSSWCHPESGSICPDQGGPCQKCLRDERADWGDETVCKFCSDNARVDVVSPCFASECQDTEDYEGAKACDDHVDRFCAATQLAGLRDLGCDKYVQKSRLYTVPTVPNKCEYKIKSFNINGGRVHKVKLAIFTCKFEDPHGALNNTTPLYKYRHPYDSLSTEEQKALSPDARAILDSMLETRNEKLIPLDELRLDDFFPYVYPALATEEGHPFHFHQPLARLVIHRGEPEEQERYDSSGNLNCHQGDVEHRDIISLPPTSEPLRMGLKAFLMKQKWEAMNNPHGEEENEFKHFDVHAIDGGEADPRLKSTAIFGIKLSQTWKSHGHSGRMEEREDKEWICKDWSQVDWNDIENDPDCSSIENSIRNGQARIWFEQNLFQAGCADDECDLRVDHCREIGLTPQRLEVDSEGFAVTAKRVLAEVEKMTEADSWPSLVEKFIHVSAAASTQAYDDAIELFNRLVVRGKQTKFMKDIPDYCEHDYHVDHTGKRNPAWEKDPCCNWELRQYQCCAPKDIPNGFIDVVLDVNRAQVSTYCQGYSSEVENLLQDVMVNIDQAASCAEKIESSVSSNVWDETWKIKDICYQKIYDAESVECEKDEDCAHCSASTCRIQAGSQTGKCTVPWDDTEGCMLECLSNEMDPELVRYLKKEWNVPATADNLIFREAFIQRMTEPACSGPRAWEQDIGRNGFEWECNATCTADHICDDWDYMEHLQQIARQEGHHNWIDFNNDLVCESFNGTKNHWGQCLFSSLADTSPCKQENECYEECQKPHSADGCAELGGTWIQKPGEFWGRCCSPDMYVFYDRSRGEKICSYIPEGSPNGWELRSPACCETENGSWKVDGEGNGQCCLGKWMSHTYEGQTHSYCQTESWGWDNSECYEECDSLRNDCQTCRVDKQDCCGEVYKSANRTACESYMQCTDSHIWEDSGQICNDPTPFCAICHGKHCYKTGESPSCFVHVQQQECEGELEGLSTEWDTGHHRCKVITNSVPISGWDCFTPGPSICPDPTDYPWSYNHDSGLIPATQWGERTCDQGCYVPTLPDQETCQAASDYAAGIYYYWEAGGGNGNGVCKVWGVDEAECAAISGGTHVPYSLSFSSGRFVTEDECNEGLCMGNLGWGGWSREQCESSAKHSCTRSCQSCVTWNWPFNNQGYGACFSLNTTTCGNEGETQVPCIVSSVLESDCVITNELQVEWKTCSSYNTDTDCNDEDSLDTYAKLLGCSWHWGACETEEACEAVGECNDWDNQRHECKDAGWEHGDTCWASYLVESTNEETQRVTSTYEYASCNQCREYDGVCVEPRPDRGCDDQKWHKLGCKVYGKHDEASCKSANSTNEWYTRAKTKEDCLAIKGCKEPGRHISDLPPEECTLCSGELQPIYEWHGGAWVKPNVQHLTWMDSGTHMAPVNEWKPAIADYLLEKELALPIIKRFANKKQTQALLMFNTFSAALQTLTCACGSENRTDCFDLTEGSVAGVSKAFCDLETPINAACGTAVVRKNCITAEERRSRRLSETESMAGDSMDITWIHYSAGAYGNCFEPYSSVDDRILQNPLAVRNVNGIVVGQLVGDGKGMISTGDFESMELCLARRTDVREWDAFDVPDVGKLSDDGVTIVPQYNTEWIVNDGLKMCFIAIADGVYFPIFRADSSWEAISQLGVDNSRVTCDTTKGIALYNATSDSLLCVCRCGYSGETCDTGCPNNCSGHGQCLENGECGCVATRTGVDCGEFNCPIGLQGKRCSGQGLCKEDATCECEDNFVGLDCSDTKLLPQQVAPTPSFGEFQPPQASLTSAPSLMPSDTPSVSPRPSVQPSTKPSSQPTSPPSGTVSKVPSSQPSDMPSRVSSSSQPSEMPSLLSPSVTLLSSTPSLMPSVPMPSFQPSEMPSSLSPSVTPSVSSAPSLVPSVPIPSSQPSDMPSVLSAPPSVVPVSSSQPSSEPPTGRATTTPTEVPSGELTTMKGSCQTGPCDCSTFPTISGILNYCNNFTPERHYFCDKCCLAADCVTPRTTAPSEPPTGTPVDGPLSSSVPSQTPSLSSAPSSMSSEPSILQSTTSPTAEQFGSVEISFEVGVTLDGIDVSDLNITALDEVVDLLETVFGDMLPEGAIVRLLKVGGFSVTRRLLRFLEDDGLGGVDIEFEIIMTQACSSAKCDDSEADEISATLYHNVTSEFEEKVSSGELATSIQEEAVATGVSEMSNVTLHASTLQVGQAKVTVKEAEENVTDDPSRSPSELPVDPTDDNESSSYKYGRGFALPVVVFASMIVLFAYEIA